MNILETRIAQLEARIDEMAAQNRRAKRVALLALVCASVPFLFAGSLLQTPKVLRASKFELIENGKVAASLGKDAYGPCLEVFHKGRRSIRVGQTSDGVGDIYS